MTNFPENNFRKTLFCRTLVFLFALFLADVAPTNSQQLSNGKNKEFATEITLKNLSYQFSFNSVVAEDLWMGKRILTKATVTSVDDGLDNRTVSVQLNDGIGVDLVCRHSRSEQEFREIGRGMRLWILGRLIQEVNGLEKDFLQV